MLKEGRCALASTFASYKYMLFYGETGTFIFVMSSYFGVLFSDWNFVFMDCFWVISMAFTLPFAKAADKLAPSRLTSSLFSAHTLTSFLGIIVINFLFLVLAWGVLSQQDFYQCRKWEDSIIQLFSIGDNNETTVIFLVASFQFVLSAIPLNFGFEHRASFFRNWLFVSFVVIWVVIHFTVILYPSRLSCFFRVNCENKNVYRGAVFDFTLPIQNPWHHTMMPFTSSQMMTKKMMSLLPSKVKERAADFKGTMSWLFAKEKQRCEGNNRRSISSCGHFCCCCCFCCYSLF